MGIEEEMDQKLDDLKEEWAMSQLPRAVSLVSHQDILYKLYTDGTVFMYDPPAWREVEEDTYIKEKLKEIKENLQ